jgi:hypothetical protein
MLQDHLPLYYTITSSRLILEEKVQGKIPWHHKQLVVNLINKKHTQANNT